MNDKIITYADLDTLRRTRGVLHDGTPQASLLDRLIAAAEADAPPLPEGWVLVQFDGEARGAYWHHDGALFRNDRCTSTAQAYDVGVTVPRDRITPLRPTVTAEDVERASASLRKRGMDYYSGEVAREMFKAAGIEVTS